MKIGETWKSFVVIVVAAFPPLLWLAILLPLPLCMHKMFISIDICFYFCFSLYLIYIAFAFSGKKSFRIHGIMRISMHP